MLSHLAATLLIIAVYVATVITCLEFQLQFLCCFFGILGVRRCKGHLCEGHHVGGMVVSSSRCPGNSLRAYPLLLGLWLELIIHSRV